MAFDPAERINAVIRHLPLIQTHVQARLPRQLLGGQGWEPQHYVDYLTDTLVVELTNYFASQPLVDVIDISYPKDWWEAVKERFAPKWFLRRYPVRRVFHYADVRNLYPEFIVPKSFGREVRFAEHQHWEV